MRTIKRNICLEELKSRIPGLFPYLDFNEFGLVVKHKAIDSVDGCYGKIIPDFVVNFNDNNGNAVSEKYSYRTLISMLYQGIEKPLEKIKSDLTVRYELPDGSLDGSFPAIDGERIDISEMIGKFYVNLDDYSEEQSLVPEYVYASEAKELLDRMIKLKKSCSVSSLSAGFCCDCREFYERGGDTMVEFLIFVSEQGEKIANAIFDFFGDDTGVSLHIDLSSTIEDFGYYTSLREKRYDGGDNLCKEETHEIGDYTQTKFGGYTDSKLKSLRRYTTYIGNNGSYEKPEKDTDWLYFYRKGYVANYETINDDFGNIAFQNDSQSQVFDGAFVTNLEAYGNILFDIERNTEEHTLTFTYYINAHLKAESAGSSQDDDGNTFYYYKYPFVYDSGGVKQTETYYYDEDGEIANLSDSEFDKLIGGGTVVDENWRFEENQKYEFFTMSSNLTYKKVIFDRNTDIDYMSSQFEYEKVDVEIESDYCYRLFKEDYLTGVHYAPIVSNNVNIQRGNNAAFERHIRLGEIKTLEDMENYQNGSFFNIQETI